MINLYITRPRPGSYVLTQRFSPLVQRLYGEGGSVPRESVLAVTDDPDMAVIATKWWYQYQVEVEERGDTRVVLVEGQTDHLVSALEAKGIKCCLWRLKRKGPEKAHDLPPR